MISLLHLIEAEMFLKVVVVIVAVIIHYNHRITDDDLEDLVTPANWAVIHLHLSQLVH